MNADVYKHGAERMAAIANCLNTVLILGCCVNICSAGRSDGLLTHCMLYGTYSSKYSKMMSRIKIKMCGCRMLSQKR